MPQKNSTKIKEFRKTQCKTKQDNRSRVNVMCTSLVATFVICWFPQHVWRLSRLRGIPISDDKVVLCLIKNYENLNSNFFINSGITFLLYIK